ncbi:MAG TPA: hypothetical protein VNG91_06090 [Terriglobia bacterium]|nr:hypothetical protein [Terriglobia bacterium]
MSRSQLDMEAELSLLCCLQVIDTVARDGMPAVMEEDALDIRQSDKAAIAQDQPGIS